MVTSKPITIDSRFFWRAQTKNGGYYWKTFDTFTRYLISIRLIRKVM